LAASSVGHRSRNVSTFLMPVAITFTTPTVAVALFPSLVAVMTAGPAERPVARPACDTAATASLLDVM
jgi:hypothetical protein